MAQSIYKFDMPDSHKSIIKVIGVGGGGSNAVTYMYSQGIRDVEFLVCNTDSQHLKSCGVPQKLQIGVNITKGLGAGARPERGRESALENKEEIREVLSANTRMVFITAGMGGGTGTGAAPVVAKIARELDILTIGIVTLPFKWEGSGKKRQALEGIHEMKQACDTVIIINNDKLQELFGKLEISESFSKANDVLLTAAKSIAEVITVQSEINVDFADVERVMKNSGAAVMGSAVASGEGRSMRAIEQALYSPLIDSGDVFGAKNILLSIAYGPDAKFTMDELTDITDYITEKVGDEADVIPGLGLDETLGDAIRVTVIATGFDENKPSVMRESKKVIDLESNRQISMFDTTPTPEVKKTNDSIFTFERPQTVQEPKKENKINPQNQHPEEIVFKKIDLFSEPDEQKEQKREYVFDLESDKKSQDWEVKVKEDPQPEIKQQLQVTDKDKEKLSKSFEDRIKRLSSLSTSQNLDPEEFKEKLEVPAYLRKKVDLKDQPHSSERNVSKFTLNEDNDILGNNKFLHDNVD
ncbi:MAG: cell division protein FtsZ [Cytophagaceae bacterium]|jgi:cell division protein FtsZ|nr:cell division protein FtsZ [Cytophagaceae bacterium]